MRVQKDLIQMREGDKAQKQRDRKQGELRDFSMQHDVRVYWDLNKDSIRDRIFKLSIDGVEVLLDAEQMSRYVRWI